MRNRSINMKLEYRRSTVSAPFQPVYESRRWQSVRLSVFLCDDLFCVFFSWASLIYHCVSSGLSPSVLCLNQIFLFFFLFCFYNALHFQKRQHVRILKPNAPPWLHDSHTMVYLSFPCFPNVGVFSFIVVQK